MVAPPPGLACDTWFKNGSSVANCVYRLTCCFVSVVDDRTRSRFALVSRSVRMIKGGVRVHYAAGSSTERDTNGRVRGPPLFLALAALPVASSVSMVALAPSRRQCHGVNGSVVMSRMRWGVSLAGSVWTALVVAAVSGYYH
jgi:hypothetical protein